jgi:hypothetical protein
MPEGGGFKFEDCLLKHHIRRNGWLPACRRRLQTLRRSLNNRTARRLRYFTFCAIGAIDVLMLEMAHVIRRHQETERFDTVFFFDKDREQVDETIKRIPGAIGFPGEFVDIVLADDPEGDDALDVLEPPQEEENTAATRRRQVLLATRREFIRCFPFDVINLDLERFFFRPNDPFPGRLINALQKIFQWQRKPFIGNNRAIEGFSLMFTTRIGPHNLGEEYLQMLRTCVTTNVQDSPALATILEARTGTVEVGVIETNDFPVFFKLSVPKLIATMLGEEDWYVEEESGITIFEFERPTYDGSYRMLHLIMDVRRKNPPKERRAPGQDSADAVAAYRNVVRRIFEIPEVLVSADTINETELQADLDKIKQHRKRYYAEE